MSRAFRSSDTASVFLAEIENGKDVRAGECRQRTGLALESGHALRIIRHRPGQDLDGRVPPQPLVARPIDLTLPALTELFRDAVMGE